MLNKLQQLLRRHRSGGDVPPLSFDDKQLAMASLLVEVALADQHIDQRELDHLLVLLQRQFAITPTEQAILAERAQSSAADATSLYQFTQLIQRECNHAEKFSLVRSMWEIAYIDGQLDKYEEYVIRKVADLIYLSHSDFIRAKHLAKNNLAG